MAVELEGLESSKNENKNEEPRTGVKVLYNLVNALSTLSKFTGNEKYKDDDTLDKKFANMRGGLRGVLDITFTFMGTMETARYGIGGIDDEISFGLKNPFTNLKSGVSSFKNGFGNGMKFSLPKIFSKEFKILPKLVLDDYRYAIGGGKGYGRVDGVQIGYYKIVGETLEMSLNIPKKLQGKGYGAQFFTQAVEESEATTFIATWVKSSNYDTGESVNLTRYQSALQNGATVEKAAFNTWSGQQAKKHGFTNVQVQEIENGIQATFSKP